jgi:methionyl-tRNA formyltransferase
MRVLFWGTPDFGLPTLEAIMKAGHRVVGVITNPDRPRGRGRKLQPSAVKAAALESGLRILQPERPRGDGFLRELAALSPDLSVVAAYGQILVDEVLALPTHGSVNVHGSLLPELRGAAPVNWAIINGHERSGVTIMRMVRELDAGAILCQEPIEIGPRMTAGELYDQASILGARLTLDTLAALSDGTLVEREQDDERATYAPKLGRTDARIDWERDAVEVGRWVRGCDPWPGAWSELEGVPVLFFQPTVEETSVDEPPGTVIEADHRSGLKVAAGSGSVRFDAVKPAGGRRMTAAEWVRGRGPRPGGRFV